MTDQNDV